MRRPGYVRRGDYFVKREHLREAREAFEERSEGSRARDLLSRAPIEPDLEEWKENQRGFDFPGVDTPTARPRRAVLDETWETHPGRKRGGEDVVHDPDPDPPRWRGSGRLGLLEEGTRVPEGTVGRVFGAFKW